jgi:transcriptional regulator with XRE-family HTH domain
MPFTKIQQKKLKALGQRVRALRKGKNLTLKQLGHASDKDYQSIQRLEQGDTNPSYLYLLQICEGLEIEITELLKGLD